MLNIEQRFKALPVLFKHFVVRPLLFGPFFCSKNEDPACVLLAR